MTKLLQTFNEKESVLKSCFYSLNYIVNKLKKMYSLLSFLYADWFILAFLLHNFCRKNENGISFSFYWFLRVKPYIWRNCEKRCE